MQMQMSAAAVKKLTAPWEEFVGYVYDDKRAKTRINGKLQYPEWDGGPVRGTLTIGFGHTDAAGAPKIEKGLRMTEEEGWRLLAKDLAPCMARVNHLLKVPVTQHQYDSLADGEFNCPSMTAHCAAVINAGHPEQVPKIMLQYTHSKGEYMVGLTHRRNAEIAWFNTPDSHAPTVVEADPETVFCPKGEREPAPRSIPSSKSVTGGASVTLGAGAIAAISAANDAAAPIIQAKQTVQDLGLLDHLQGLAQSPMAITAIALAIAAIGIFMVCDRIYKMKTEHI